VLFRQTNGSDIGLDSANLAIEFDPSLFTVTGVSLGNVTRGFTLNETYDNATGEIVASARSTSGPVTLTPGVQGSLLLIDLTIRPGASLGLARLNLLGVGRVGSQVLSTSLNDGNLTLVPAPTNSDVDSTDGVVNVVASIPSPAGPKPVSVSLAPASLLVSPGTTAGASRAVGSAVSPATVDQALAAFPLESPTGEGSAALDDLAVASTEPESLTDLIPWTPVDRSTGVLDPVVQVARKKTWAGLTILGQETPGSAGFHSRAV